jgi:hypothetical protein
MRSPAASSMRKTTRRRSSVVRTRYDGTTCMSWPCEPRRGRERQVKRSGETPCCLTSR